MFTLAPRSASTPSSKPTPPPRRRRNWFFLLFLVLLALCLCSSALAGGFVLVGSMGMGGGTTGKSSFLMQKNTSASAVVADFMTALKLRNYLKAYTDLDSTLLVSMTSNDFAHQGEQADTCYGPVSAFHLTTHTDGPGTAVYTYTVMRSNMSHPYQLQLTLQQDAQGNWAITSYGNDNTLDPPGSQAC